MLEYEFRELSRRRKIVMVSPEDILNLLVTFNKYTPHFIVKSSIEDIPEDAVISHVSFDQWRNVFLIYVCHPSFNIIEEGDIAPMLNDKYTNKIVYKIQKVHSAQDINEDGIGTIYIKNDE